ncbi:tyrosine-type recombinase/integrase [Chungangia koreensis]|uniref:Tyrosine-type recombinase/integrase n=1 Tax=Chungangia koreensis TaxID=752657 RepID=A0ABV8X2C7_9LACT
MANIQQRGEGSYFFTVYAGRGADGKYQRKTKTYTVDPTLKLSPKKLKEHVEHEYLKFKQEILSGSYVAPSKMTFATFVEQWKSKYADKELSDTAYLGHVNRLENHVLPVLAHYNMEQITSLLLLDLLSNLKRKDGKEGELSYYSKEDIYKTLKNVFKHAKMWNVIPTNPMEGVSKPKNKDKTTVKELNVYEPEEVAALLEAVQNEPIHWRIFVTLAIVAGIRRGENLGLEWSKVDFQNNQIEISQSIVKGKNGPIIKGPKSKASYRVVSLPQSVMEELKEYRIHWVKEKLKVGDLWVEEEREWLFCNLDGTHFYPDTPGNWWRKFTKRANVRYIKLHDMRHTSATLLIAQGIHAKVISERLGHANTNVTMGTYGHVLKSADRAAANTFEGLFKSKTQ